MGSSPWPALATSLGSFPCLLRLPLAYSKRQRIGMIGFESFIGVDESAYLAR